MSGERKRDETNETNETKGRETQRMRTCPTCAKRFSDPSEEELRRALPFCSPRCKMADLGRWLGGEYAVPTEERPSDEELLDALRLR